MLDGFKNVLESMISYIESEVPSDTLKFWRLQSPRHFYGGDWNQNGSCLFNEPLEENQVRVDNSFLMIFGITVGLNFVFLISSGMVDCDIKSFLLIVIEML